MDITRESQPTAGITQAVVTRSLGNLRARGKPARPSLGWHLRNWLQYRRRDVPKLAAGTLFVGLIPGLMKAEAVLRGAVYRPRLDELAPWQLETLRHMLRENFPIEQLPALFGGLVLDYGVLSRRNITTAGVNYLTDAFQNLTEVENFKYHGFGTGTGSESNGDTALGTEFTTEYATDNTRPTGSQTEGASNNIYRTVGTFSPNGGTTLAVTEHGLFSQAANSGGTVWDRSVFSAVNLVVANGDSLQVTHDTTFAAGG